MYFSSREDELFNLFLGHCGNRHKKFSVPLIVTSLQRGADVEADILFSRFNGFRKTVKTVPWFGMT
jgi:hypothetical protein